MNKLSFNSFFASAFLKVNTNIIILFLSIYFFNFLLILLIRVLQIYNIYLNVFPNIWIILIIFYIIVTYKLFLLVNLLFFIIIINIFIINYLYFKILSKFFIIYWKNKWIWIIFTWYLLKFFNSVSKYTFFGQNTISFWFLII